MHGENPLLDRCVRPHQIQQLRLGDEPSGMAKERHEEVVRLGLKRDNRSRARQSSLADIEHELAELVNFRGSQLGKPSAFLKDARLLPRYLRIARRITCTIHLSARGS